MSGELKIRPMTRHEVDTLVDWAAQEGWNPGLHDAEIFWLTDPEGFIAAEIEGELIGGGSIVSYDGRFGFMGFFIVHPEHRGHGFGKRLWFERKRLLQARLGDPAVIGMDGVFDMQSFYAEGGFVFHHRDLRYVARGRRASRPPGLVEADTVPFEALCAFDARHFPVRRPRFLQAWIRQPEGRCLVALAGGEITGYGSIRRCRSGFKVGPLFATTPESAEALYIGLADAADGQEVFLDVPENNPPAMALASRHQMREVFGCACMYLGPAPALPWDQIYGVTTFELG
jgi:GNAT superfamily N-acetyltransferase